VLVIRCVRGLREDGLGAGFAVDSKGLISTNAHVVNGCSEIHVRSQQATSWIPAKVLLLDWDHDVAMLRSENLAVPALELGDPREIKAGQRVFAIGHPQGLEYTVSDGIVAAVRYLDSDHTLIQVTAPISPGNSGGPLLDNQGKVIGMLSLYLTEGQNLNFAVSAKDISKAVDRLRATRQVLDPDVWLAEQEARQEDPFARAKAKLEAEEKVTRNEQPAIIIGQPPAPVSPSVTAALAKIYRETNEFAKAKEILDAAILESPKSSKLLLELAELAWEQGKYDESEVLTKRMLEIDATYAPAHQCMSALLMRKSQYQEARQEAEKAIALGADAEYRAYAHGIIARCALRDRDYRTAADHYRIAMRHEKVAKHGWAHALYASALLQGGTAREANKEARLALALSPNDQDIRTFLESAGLPVGVVIISRDAEWDILGNLVVTGVARNDDDVTSLYARVVAEGLDEQGTVVTTGWNFLDPVELPPGMTGSFKIYMKGNPKKGRTYRVLPVR